MNRASRRGGAIRAVRSTINLTNSSFVNNQARASGGAVFGFQSVVSFSFSLFLGNSAEEKGGAISVASSNVTVTACAFRNNSASNSGGAINTAASIANFANNSFYSNFALKRGGAVFANESSLCLLGNSFVRNDVRISGSALFISDSMLYRNETFRNVFERNHGGQGDQGPITCNSCRIAVTGKNSSASKSKAHLTEFSTVNELHPTPSVVAVNSNSPGDAFVSIIALPRETKIIFTSDSVLRGERYMLYSRMYPKVLSFFDRRIALVSGRNGLLSLGRGMKSDFNVYTDLAEAINDACTHCNLELRE